MIGTFLGVLAMIGAFLALLALFLVPLYTWMDSGVPVKWKLLSTLFSALIGAAIITALIESGFVTN